MSAKTKALNYIASIQVTREVYRCSNQHFNTKAESALLEITLSALEVPGDEF